MKKKNILTFLIGGIVLLSGLVFLVPNLKGESTQDADKIAATIYKSPTCGCCVGHAAYLESKNFSVEKVEMENINEIKDQFNIPTSMQSCHTAVMGDYFVEGHVPIEAIEKLLAEKPDIDGIALPGMPAGSPGMPGIKTGDFIIYSLKNGEASEYMRL